MNSSKVNNSILNASILDFGTIELDKIRNYIEILEEHQIKCEKSARFIEAEMAKQRVAQLRKIEKEKVILEKKNDHEEAKQRLEFSQREELQRFNERSDVDFFELNEKYTNLEKNLRSQHEIEINTFIEDFQNKYPQISKPSPEILNLNKVLENLIRQKEYANCHLVQVKIAELTQAEFRRFQEEKDRKLKKELENIKQKQEIEISSFQLRMSSAYNEFKKARAVDFDRIIQKYKNKLKDLENDQKLEMNLIGKMKMTGTGSSTILSKSQMGNQTMNRSRVTSASKK